MRQYGVILVVSILLVGLALTPGVVNVSQTAGSVSPGQSSVSSGVYFDHVVIIIMEDHGIGDICGQSPPPCSSANGAPYMASLANNNAIGSQYLGVSHFSEADYLALLGGDTFGCGVKGCPPVPNQNLVDRLESAGLAWKGYIEDQNVASGCDTTYHEPYTPEHNPFVGFTDILNSPTRCAKVVLANPSGCSATDCALVNDLNSASAPNLMWLTPNNCDNMHGFTGICPSSIPMGDNYLSSLVPSILNSGTFTQGRSALFVVFDEGNGYCPLNGSSEDCVYASWVGREARTGFVTSTLYNHYSWTKTIELNWNLPSLTSNDANATPMTEFFASPLSASFTYSPSSPQKGQQINFTGSATGGNSPYSYDWNFGDGSSGSGSTANHTFATAGSFRVTLTVNDGSSPQQTATSQETVIVTSPTTPLIASFTFTPSNPQTGQQVSFTASAGGGVTPYSYSWTFGDGATGTGQSTTHSYQSTGSFTVVLTVTDNSAPPKSAVSHQSIVVTSPPPTLTTSFRYSPTSPQIGQTVSFSGTASGGNSPYQYSWNFGDGATGSGAAVTHAYSSAGSFTVTLTTTDNGSPKQTASSQQTITIASQPAPLGASFNYSPSSPVTGQQVSFTASATGGVSPYSYSWTFGDGSSGTGSSTTHTYAAAASYTVTLTVSDNGSPQQTTTSQQTVTVANQPPSALNASFTVSSTSPQVGQSVTFTGSASGGTAPYSYSWTFGDGSTGTGSSVTHAYTSAGSYTATLTVTDNGSPQQTASAQQNISVTSPPPPPLSASFTTSPSSPQTVETVTFSGSASGGTSPYSFSWNFGDGTTGTGASTTHSYSTAGSFTITLTVTDNSSPRQTTTAQQTTTVTSPPPTLSASFSYSPSSPQTGQQVSLSASASGGTVPYTFSWSFGDGLTGSGSVATHAYSTAGSYTVILTVRDNGSPQQTTTSQQTIVVSSPPPPPLSASFTFNPTKPDAGQTVTLTASASGGVSPYGYSWDFGDSKSGSGTSVTHSYGSGGSYTISLTVTDSNGQSARSSQTITVAAPLTGSFSYSPSSPLPLTPVSFTGTASGGVGSYSYSWNFGDGSTGNGATVNHSYLLAGSYTVTLTITDGNGQSFTTAQTITVLTNLI